MQKALEVNGKYHKTDIDVAIHAAKEADYFT